jgi:hypothetical protein
MTNLQHDYPDVPLAPKPVFRTACPMCAGTGWRETGIDELGTAHGWHCAFCAGSGKLWTELEELHDQAAEARRRLTRARYLP